VARSRPSALHIIADTLLAVAQAAKRTVRHSAPTRVCRPNAQETHQRLNQASRLALLPLVLSNSGQRDALFALPRPGDSMVGGLHNHIGDMQQQQAPTADTKRSGYLDLVLQVRSHFSCTRNPR
jgi:hypothetical protein